MLLAAACGKGSESETAAKSRADSTTGAPSEASSAITNADATGRAVLFLGTSLTAGLGLDADSAFPRQVQRLITQRGLPFHTVNAGVSGETSAGLLQRLDWVLKEPAAMVIVETGANDGLRGQPVEGTRATIGRILDRIHSERPDAKVVLVQMEAPPNLGADYTRAFHGMFPVLAREHGAVLMPFLLDSVAGFPRLNQSDGIHPNFDGERIVTRTVWRTIGPLLEALAKESAGIATRPKGS